MSIDLDVGVGEGLDAAVIPLIDSTHIACGGHAGDERTMRATVALVLRHGSRLLAAGLAAAPAERVSPITASLA